MSAAPRPTRLAAFGPSLEMLRRALDGSRLALGLAGLGGAWGPVDEAESLATVREALARGMRVFDVAPSYGIAERLLGEALAGWQGVPIAVSTKVGRLPARDAHEAKYDYAPAALRRSLESSLAALGRSQVELLFLHEPQLVPRAERPGDVTALRELQAAGLTLRLGLAGGHGADWDGFVESGAFDVAMLFRRLDPCILDGLVDDVPRLRDHQMGTYGASPLHMGLLGARYEEFTHARPDWVWGPQIDRAIRLKALAEKHGLALPSLAHRFTMSIAELDRVVIGAGNRRELAAALADFAAGPLPPALFEEVCSLTLS